MQRTAMKVGQILDIWPWARNVSMFNTEGATDKMNTVAL